MPQVDFKRKEVVKLAKQWDIIRDCIEGELAVKWRQDKYLPRPNPDDTSPDNRKRYTTYLERAVFYNVTRRTLAGLIGLIFNRDPVIEVPPSLDTVKADATGSGMTLVQLAKYAAHFVVPYGRSGFLTDYPEAKENATVQELKDGFIRPTIDCYAPEDIINWRTKTRGGREISSLVVLHEEYIADDDGFKQEMRDQWRVLILSTVLNLKTQVSSDVYTVEIWRAKDRDRAPYVSSNFFLHKTYTPLDANGEPLNEIPWEFIGAESNEPKPNDPPMYDIASLNIAHYRNSADYEESSFIVGQPTPYFTGLTEEWVKKVLKGKIPLGAQGVIPLPEGAQAGLLQAQPNIQPFEAMQHKERQMVALGAKLIEEKQVQRTATEAGIENTSENSVLSSVADNVSAALTRSLEWCLQFVDKDAAALIAAKEVRENEETGEDAKPAIQFELSTEFDLVTMSPEERKQLIAEWQAGAIAWEEMREGLHMAGIAKLDDEEAKELIANEMADSMALDVETAAAMTEATTPPADPADPNAPPAKPAAVAKPKPKPKAAKPKSAR